MAKISVEKFLELVKRCKLVEIDQLQRALADIRSQATRPRLRSVKTANIWPKA
jgi:hypothetical protein